MDSGNRTEQATPQRKHKAREKGQVPRSRELSGALSLSAALFTMYWQGDSPLLRWRRLFSGLLYASSVPNDAPVLMLQATMWTTFEWVLPIAVVIFACGSIGSLTQGGFVFATSAVAPDIERFSPGKKIKQLLSMSALSNSLRSLIPFAVIALLAYKIVVRDWQVLIAISFRSPGQIFSFTLLRCLEVAWKSALVLLVWSCVDYLLIRQNHSRNLRMTRQEVREEVKENEGNPEIKAQIRRLQRQRGRRKMLRAVEQATVVVTNPTHFAVALEYKSDMAAPVVVAKGQDHLAQEIKKTASWHGIPQVENQPLARALYRSVDIGQPIPAKLYVAVAEILAFVYRTQQRVSGTPGGDRAN